jgi:hypothetical protein
MKPKTIISLIIIVLMASSCVLSSLFPLYTEKDLRTNDGLVGKWLVNDDNEQKGYWIIEKLDSASWKKYNTGKTYRLVVVEDSLEQEFALHLLELNGIQYVDFYPVDVEIDHGFLSWHLVPVHNFAKIEIERNQLILYFFEYDYFKGLLEQNKIRISNVRLNNGTWLITAETDELQKFVKKYGHELQAYAEPDTLPRLPL